MNYRRANTEDAQGIANVLMNCYNIDSITEGTRAFDEERSKNYHYIVADDGEKVVGLTTWLRRGLPKHELVELDRIAVLPEYQGNGLARDLFNALIEDANREYQQDGYRLRKLYLLTHADNEGAHVFYEKMGLHHEATMKDHYYKGKDEFVLAMFF